MRTPAKRAKERRWRRLQRERADANRARLAAALGHELDPEATVLHLFEYEITDEPMPDPAYERLAPADRERIQRAAEQVHDDAGAAVADLERIVAEFPDLPTPRNHLAAAYGAAGEHDRAAPTIEETYRRFPAYLFGMCNYVELCIRRGRLDEAAEILEGKFVLRDWCPGRRVFHVSEFVAFHGVVAIYLLATARLEEARRMSRMIDEVAPDHPMAERIRDLVSPRGLRALLERAARRVQAPARVGRSGPAITAVL